MWPNKIVEWALRKDSLQLRLVEYQWRFALLGLEKEHRPHYPSIGYQLMLIVGVITGQYMIGRIDECILENDLCKKRVHGNEDESVQYL